MLRLWPWLRDVLQYPNPDIEGKLTVGKYPFVTQFRKPRFLPDLLRQCDFAELLVGQLPYRCYTELPADSFFNLFWQMRDYPM